MSHVATVKCQKQGQAALGVAYEEEGDMLDDIMEEIMQRPVNKPEDTSASKQLRDAVKRMLDQKEEADKALKRLRSFSDAVNSTSTSSRENDVGGLRRRFTTAFPGRSAPILRPDSTVPTSESGEPRGVSMNGSPVFGAI